jgi:hypothetical protein
MKLTVLFDDDAGQQAYDSLNTLRDITRKLADERRRHGLSEAYQALAIAFDQAAGPLLSEVLAGAVIWREDAGDVQHPG